MSMTFFYLLRDNGYDWDKAREIFYNLTDIRVAWINAIVRQEKEENRRQMEKEQRHKRFGGSGHSKTHSFDLRE